MSETLKAAQARKLAFRQHLKPQIQFRGAVASLCGLAVSFTNFWRDLRQEQDPGLSNSRSDDCKGDGYHFVRYSFDLADPRTPYFASNILIMSALTMFIILCMLGCFNKLHKVIWWESAFCITACIVVVGVPLAGSDLIATFVVHPDQYESQSTWCSWNHLNNGSFRNPFLRIALFIDVITTVIALYIPLRFIAMLPIFVLGNLSYLSCALLLTNSTANEGVETWMMPASSLILLGLAAYRGAHDQDLLRWQTWRAQDELHTISGLLMAFERIATSFCDLVIPLTPDFRLQSEETAKAQSIFGSSCGSCLFTDFLSASDASRFNEMVAQTRDTNVPGCIPVTLHPHGRHLPLEVNLLMVLTASGSFVLGISQISEQALPVADMAFQSPPTFWSHDSDAHSHSNINTERAFSEGDLEQIMEIGQSEHWLVPQHSFAINFNEVLGEGKQSIVYSGTYCGNSVAVKYAKHQDTGDANIARAGKQLLYAARELRALRQVRHPNIVLLHGACISEDSLVLVLEVVKGQTLYDFAHGRKKALSVTYQQHLMLDICSALWYLSLQEPYPIVHGDLKPANIMVEVRVPGVGAEFVPHAKLIDFGLSRILSPRAKPLGGTTHWRAPETFVAGKPTVGADIFSFGCVLFYIMTAKVPYSLNRDETLVYITYHSSLPPLPWPPSSSACQYDMTLVQLCSSCTSLEPEARPTWPKVKELITLSCSAAALRRTSSPSLQISRESL